MAPVVRRAARPRLASSHRPERVSKFLRSSTLHQPRQWRPGAGAARQRPADVRLRVAGLVVVRPVAVVAWMVMPLLLLARLGDRVAVALGVGGQRQEHLLQAGTVGWRGAR